MTTQTTPFSTARTTHLIPHHIVADRAYAIWLARGQPLGCEYDHWVEAEVQLLASRLSEQEGPSSRLLHWSDPLGTEIERALDSLTPSFGQRSVTSL
jgi:Protein of unknown function (DUF2934)